MQADVERLLARLLTDSGFRRRFVADPVSVAREEGLSPEEAQAMARLPTQDLKTAARSYEHKRAPKLKRGARHWLIGWFRTNGR